MDTDRDQDAGRKTPIGTDAGDRYTTGAGNDATPRVQSDIPTGGGLGADADMDLSTGRGIGTQPDSETPEGDRPRVGEETAVPESGTIDSDAGRDYATYPYERSERSRSDLDDQVSISNKRVDRPFEAGATAGGFGGMGGQPVSGSGATEGTGDTTNLSGTGGAAAQSSDTGP